MATTTEYAAALSRSSPSSAARSPDTSSHVYPERPIRPLPRNRLKSKLSPEQVSSIIYPPDPPPVSPTLSFGLQENGILNQQSRLVNGDVKLLHYHERPAVHNHCTCGGEADSGDEEIEFDHPDYRYTPVSATSGTAAKPTDSVQSRLIEASRASGKPAPPGSTASSADGYDSFENTNNKKKRKIPVSGVSSMHQSQLSAELASMGISNSKSDGAADEGIYGFSNGSQHQYSAGSGSGSSNGAGTGISGAGRGRYGRHEVKPRRPFGSSGVNPVNGYNARTFVRNDVKISASETDSEKSNGIISKAIKSAAEHGPLTSTPTGRENVSLLQSATSATSTAPKTQFTFTCESDSASKMIDQQTAAAAAYATGTPTPSRHGPPGIKGTGSHGTQTATSLRGNQANSNGRQTGSSSKVSPATAQHQQAAAPPKPKPRRNPAREYAFQELNRRKQQQYQNYHHLPKREDMWVCEFCEYEDIFGVPPYAMIRRYEIKDRQERKKAAEKRRLLEKAKMKGRKNKKGGSKGGKINGGNQAAAHSIPSHQQQYDPNMPPLDGDEYYDDDEEYGDEYEPIGPDDQYPHDYYPPPAPVSTPAPPITSGIPRTRG